MPNIVNLLFVSYSIDEQPNRYPRCLSLNSQKNNRSRMVERSELTLSLPKISQKARRSWLFKQTSVPDSSSSSAYSLSMSSVKTISYWEEQVSAHCLIYYEEQEKLRRKLIVAELNSDLLLEDAIRHLTSYCGSLKRLGKTSGKVYRATNRAYKEFEEMHVSRDGRVPLRAYNKHFFVFDTTGYVSKKVPVNMETFPIWYI